MVSASSIGSPKVGAAGSPGDAFAGAESYRHRHHAFRRPVSYRLTDDAITWRDDDGGVGRLAYAAIKEVRIAYRPSRAQDNQYRTDIRTRRGGGRLVITSSSYVGFAKFEDHSPAYAAFIRELHRRIVASGARPVFAKGSTRLGYIGNWMLSIFSVLGLVFVAYMMSTGVTSAITDYRFWTVLPMFPVLWVFMRASRPQRYDPQHIPEDGLPKAAASEIS